jgi:hypothetical protein
MVLILSNSGSRNKTTYLEFSNFKGPSIQSLKLEVPLCIGYIMWKVFMHPTCASDFFLKKTSNLNKFHRRTNVIAIISNILYLKRMAYSEFTNFELKEWENES